MRKISIFFLSLCALAFGLVSCSDDNYSAEETTQQKDKEENSNILETLNDEKFLLKKEFGFALMKGIKQSAMLRELIKQEALKMFDKDYEILVYSILDKTFEDGSSFEELINTNAKNDFQIKALLRLEPTLTLLVPELPFDSFSAKLWDTTSDIPAIAIRTNIINDVPLITPEDEIGIIPGDAVPGFPVLVVKNNERVIANTNMESSKFNKIKTNIISKKDGVVLKFWDNAFDNSIVSSNVKDNSGRGIRSVDQKIEDAFSIYEDYEAQNSGINGWQRDYIYYGISPTKTKGPFSYDFQEHITSFSMSGDAMKAYKKISDQSDDPKFENNHRINTSHWTGGFFEFKVRTIINAKNGVGNELINGFTANPEDLFTLRYETYTKGTWFWKRTYYRLKSISTRTFYPNLPIINWDLDSYASSIKIEIEEVDISTTTVITDTRTVKFAQNFEISPTFGEKVKVGMKFGQTSEKTETHTVQKTFTQGNDEMGEAVINFSDKVILKKEKVGRRGWLFSTREYTSGLGYCTFSVEPLRVQ